MDFLTTEYVKQEAEKGTLEALKCSREHHHQGATADKVDLIVGIEGEGFYINGAFCACCQRFTKQGGALEDCPLYTDGCDWDECCGGKMNAVKNTLTDFKSDYSNANFKAFQEAETDLCKYIEGKIVEEEAKECKCKALDKPELRHGDYAYAHFSGDPRLYLNKGGTIVWCDNEEIVDSRLESKNIIIGNIFDDLRERCGK